MKIETQIGEKAAFLQYRKISDCLNCKKAYCDCCKIERTYEMQKKYSRVWVRRFLYKNGQILEVAETWYRNCTKSQAIAAFNHRKTLTDNGYGSAVFVRAED